MRRRASVVAVLLAIGIGAAVSACAPAPCTLPPPPISVAGRVSGTYATITWAPAARATNGYVLEAGSTPGASDRTVVKIEPPLSGYSTSAPPGTYYVRVRSRDACGSGPPSTEITVVSGVYDTHPEVVVVPRTRERNTYFPSVANLKDGRLLVAYYDSPAHVSPLGRISMVESGDSGRTWSEPRVIVDTPLDDRDPSIAVTRSGRLLLSYFAFDPRQSTSAGVFVVRSDDDGVTWSAPSRVNTGLNGGATSSKIVEADNGDLLIPIYGAPPRDVSSRAAFVRSRDGGKTWPRRDEVVFAFVPGMNFSEPALAIAGGRLLGILRTDREDSVGYATRSVDRGVTWSPPISLGMAAQSSEFVTLSGEPPMTVVHLWADWSHRWGDSRPTIASKVHWPDGDAPPVFGEPRVLYNSNCDDTGYPSGVLLNDGRVFVVSYDACLGYIGGFYVAPATLRD